MNLREAIVLAQESFKAAQERGDAAYYVRPELAWAILEGAERGEEGDNARLSMLLQILEASGHTVVWHPANEHGEGVAAHWELGCFEEPVPPKVGP